MLDQSAQAASERMKAAPCLQFTPDGHLVGSIGEVIATSRYGLILTTASIKIIDVWGLGRAFPQTEASCPRTPLRL